MDIKNDKLITLRKRAYTKNRTITKSIYTLIAITIIILGYIITMVNAGIINVPSEHNIVLGDMNVEYKGKWVDVFVANAMRNDAKNFFSYYGFVVPSYIFFILSCTIFFFITHIANHIREKRSEKELKNILDSKYGKIFKIEWLREPNKTQSDFTFKVTDEDKKEYTGEISVSNTESIITTTYDDKPITISHEKVKSKAKTMVIIAYIIIMIILITDLIIVHSYGFYQMKH